MMRTFLFAIRFLPFPQPTSSPIDPGGRFWRNSCTIGQGWETVSGGCCVWFGSPYLVASRREMLCDVLVDLMDVLLLVYLCLRLHDALSLRMQPELVPGEESVLFARKKSSSESITWPDGSIATWKSIHMHRNPQITNRFLNEWTREIRLVSQWSIEKPILRWAIGIRTVFPRVLSIGSVCNAQTAGRNRSGIRISSSHNCNLGRALFNPAWA